MRMRNGRKKKHNTLPINTIRAHGTGLLRRARRAVASLGIISPPHQQRLSRPFGTIHRIGLGDLHFCEVCVGQEVRRGVESAQVDVAAQSRWIRRLVRL